MVSLKRLQTVVCFSLLLSLLQLSASLSSLVATRAQMAYERKSLDQLSQRTAIALHTYNDENSYDSSSLAPEGLIPSARP